MTRYRVTLSAKVTAYADLTIDAKNLDDAKLKARAIARAGWRNKPMPDFHIEDETMEDFDVTSVAPGQSADNAETDAKLTDRVRD